MTLIVRDLMIGNPKLAEMGYEEEAYGYNAIASGFQGQREWTDYQPSADVLEAILCSSFDWNGIREPYMVATENDNLNAITMLFNHYLSHTAQIFADVRAFWSPEAVKRVTGWQPDGLAAAGFIHLINSGPAALDGTGEQKREGKPVMKPHWEIEDQEIQACLEAVSWRPTYMDQFAGEGIQPTSQREVACPSQWHGSTWLRVWDLCSSLRKVTPWSCRKTCIVNWICELRQHGRPRGSYPSG